MCKFLLHSWVERRFGHLVLYIYRRECVTFFSCFTDVWRQIWLRIYWWGNDTRSRKEIYETLPNLLKTKYLLHFCKKIYVLVKLPATSSRNALVHDFSLLHHRTRTTTTPADFYRKFSLMASGKKVFNGCDASSKSILPQKNEQNHEKKIVWPKIRP